MVKILEAAQEAQAVLRHAAPVEEEEEETSVTPRGSPELVRQCVSICAFALVKQSQSRIKVQVQPHREADSLQERAFFLKYKY